MNRVLYQLSYAAKLVAEISFVIISKEMKFVKRNLQFFYRNFWQYFSREGLR